MNVSKPIKINIIEHPPDRGGVCKKNVKVGWDRRLQRQNLFMAFNRVPR